MDVLLAASADDVISISYPFQFDSFLIGLMWGVWVVLNLWIWQKTKALSNMLMLCGAAASALFYIIHAFTWRGPGPWLVLTGTAALTVGFFMSVRPLVEAQLAAIRAKMHSATASKKEGGGTPPPSA